MNTFPHNPAISLKIMEIGIDLQFVNDSTIFGHSIHRAVEQGKVRGIIKEIFEQSKDNYQAVADIVGLETLKKIEKFYSCQIQNKPF